MFLDRRMYPDDWQTPRIADTTGKSGTCPTKTPDTHGQSWTGRDDTGRVRRSDRCAHPRFPKASDLVRTHQRANGKEP